MLSEGLISRGQEAVLTVKGLPDKEGGEATHFAAAVRMSNGGCGRKVPTEMRVHLVSRTVPNRSGRGYLGET